jgi:hypothetical protein
MLPPSENKTKQNKNSAPNPRANLARDPEEPSTRDGRSNFFSPLFLLETGGGAETWRVKSQNKGGPSENGKRFVRWTCVDMLIILA